MSRVFVAGLQNAGFSRTQRICCLHRVVDAILRAFIATQATSFADNGPWDNVPLGGEAAMDEEDTVVADKHEKCDLMLFSLARCSTHRLGRCMQGAGTAIHRFAVQLMVDSSAECRHKSELNGQCRPWQARSHDVWGHRLLTHL